MSRSRFAVALVVVAAFAAAGPPARAETRTLTATLPSDAQRTISGIPNNPDVRQVHMVYDTAGSLTITVDFWHPVNALDTSQNYAFWAYFSIGTANTSDCDASGGLNGQHHVFATVETFYDQASIAGYGGTLAFARTVSPDNMEITITASNPALANHNWDCASYTLNVRSYSTSQTLPSRYDVICNCWYVTQTLDSITGSGTVLPFVYFDGFSPPPLHALSVSLTGSGRGSVTGSGIRCPQTCSHRYPAGTAVSLTATAKPGWKFAGWSGGGCSGTGGCKARISADTQVRATFSPRPPVLSALGVSPRKFTLTGRLVNGRCVATTAGNRKKRTCTQPIALRLSYKLTFTARLTFTIKRELTGRLAKGRCVPVTRANQKQRRCTRLISLTGSFTRTSAAGIRSSTFNGRIGRRKLTPGSYRLTDSPTANGRTGKAQSVSFQILR